MGLLKTLYRLRGTFGRGASVAITSAILAGCATATQTPELCSTPQAQRDPKCAEQARKAKAAQTTRAARTTAAGTSAADSGSDY